MKSFLYHLQINIDPKNLDFYMKLMTFMGWSAIFENTEMAGYKNGTNGDLWFIKASKTSQNDYDAPGVNHISLKVETKQNVDEVKDYLTSNNISMLFNTPKHRSEFVTSEDQTYYQIMFESPDKILFEVVYIGPK